MKILIIRGDSGEPNNDLGYLIHKTLNTLNIKNILVEHGFIIRNQLKLKKYTHLFLKEFLKANFFDQREIADKNVLKKCKIYKPDLIIVCKGMDLRITTLIKIRKILPKVKIFNYYLDNILLNQTSMEALVEYDFIYLIDTYVEDRIKSLGIKNVKAIFPFAFKADYEIPKNNLIYNKSHQYDLSLIGSIYPYRAHLIKNLKNLNLKIWGGGLWGIEFPEKLEILKSHSGERAWGTKKNFIFRNSKININTLQPLELINGVNSRLFQIAASNSFQICQYSKDLEKVFKINEEIIIFETSEELMEKVKYYLKNDDLRKKTANKSYLRYLKDHTAEKRISTILDDFTNMN